MNIIAYSSFFNSVDTLRTLINALPNQTYPIGEIVVVENRCSRAVLQEDFPAHITVLRHLHNLGTSGAVATGFQYAQSHGYDWMWVLDQDTIPESDALERLIELYRSFNPEIQERIGILSSVVTLHPSQLVLHGRRLTPCGTRPTKVDSDRLYYECDATIWSGSLYNLKAVKKVGLPRFGVNGCWEDFALDYGDLEFSFRIKQAGYKVIGHNPSRIIHPIGDLKHLQLFHHTIYSTNHSPFRRYLYFRNMVYFWLYLYSKPNLFMVILYFAYRFFANCGKILLLETNRLAKIQASILGLWDGWRKNLHHRRFFDV